MLVFSVASPQTANVIGAQPGVIVPAAISVTAQVLVPITQTTTPPLGFLQTTTYATSYLTSTSIYVTTSSYISFSSSTSAGGSWIYDPSTGTLTILADPSSITVNYSSETYVLNSPLVIPVNDFQDSHSFSVNQNRDNFHGMKVASSSTGQRIKNIQYDSSAVQVQFNQTGTVLLTIQADQMPVSVYADNVLLPEATQSVTTTVFTSPTATSTVQTLTTITSSTGTSTFTQAVVTQTTETAFKQDRYIAPRNPPPPKTSVPKPVPGGAQRALGGLALIPMSDDSLDLLLPLGNNQVVLIPGNVVTITAIMSMIGGLLWYSRRKR